MNDDLVRLHKHCIGGKIIGEDDKFCDILYCLCFEISKMCENGV